MMNLKLLYLVLCVPFINSQDYGDVLRNIPEYVERFSCLPILYIAARATVKAELLEPMEKGVYAGAKCNTPADESKIIGGKGLPISNASFMATVEYGKNFFCSAVQISTHWLTSTAKYIKDIIDKKVSAYVRAGTDIPIARGSVFGIQKKTPHLDYNDITLAYNIGVIQLKGRGITPNINMKPISLLNAIIPNSGNVEIAFYGYGLRMHWGTVRMLLGQLAKVIPQPTCNIDQLIEKGKESIFCAANSGSAACEGDDGGAGVYRSRLAGIISSGLNCLRGDYIVFIRISAVRSWIKNVTGV